jgi:hypothetical protein
VNAIEDDRVEEEVQYYEKEYRGKVQPYVEEDSEVENDDDQVTVIKVQQRVMNPKLVDQKRDKPNIPNPIRSINVQPTRPPMFEKFSNVCYSNGSRDVAKILITITMVKTMMAKKRKWYNI